MFFLTLKLWNFFEVQFKSVHLFAFVIFPICLLKEAFFSFSVPPRIEDAQSSSDKVRTEGSDVSLECHATGSPTPVVTWKREDGTSINIDKANNISGNVL